MTCAIWTRTAIIVAGVSVLSAMIGRSSLSMT
eukprot:CAMPEP_0198148996 /NCGR_PEP_ID=MMETSP1443-20131203/44515_1 /TAXON_ID=186043 /ORGANISM="Entomoneis sp., Strain CCMP2396" /LENGTH=31 /DNA_ID= /DNA_START= /DNA_END= /DNA_ORIENTATION=